jgi:hypothetical protein
MHPSERVRFVTETARAVIAGRLDPAEGAAAVELQAEQIAHRLRGDRNGVTRSEAESVATQLRVLAEQVNDHAADGGQPEAHIAIATAIGTLAQTLR